MVYKATNISLGWHHLFLGRFLERKVVRWELALSHVVELQDGLAMAGKSHWPWLGIFMWGKSSTIIYNIIYIYIYGYIIIIITATATATATTTTTTIIIIICNIIHII